MHGLVFVMDNNVSVNVAENSDLQDHVYIPDIGDDNDYNNDVFWVSCIATGELF